MKFRNKCLSILLIGAITVGTNGTNFVSRHTVVKAAETQESSKGIHVTYHTQAEIKIT